MQYSVSTFSVTRGRIATSNSLVSDGSTLPLNITWTHVRDSATGNYVDSLFSTKYPIGVWTAAYNSSTDTTYALIMAKRATEELEPIVVNQTSGVLEANSGTYYIPVGTYIMDLAVSNVVGTVALDSAITIVMADGRPVETSPETGSYSLSLLYANTASSYGTLFNGSNNPFVVETISRFADTPNVFILKVLDKNGTVFSVKDGEVMKRPNSGIDPDPVYLQNFEDYSPDTYEESDSGTLSIKFPLVPFPISSLGNGYNMYYRIPTEYVHIDSTSTWSSNTEGNYYQGTSDSHYLGTYTDGLYDFSFRIPIRIQVPGSYELTIQLLNATHQ
ncbi:MAG: hypothetical protein QM610_14465 [Chitinophagaceae bacterium]